MTPRIAYFGDSPLPGAASYLAGIMTHFGMPFMHVPPADPPPDSAFADTVGLYVLSDYPSARIPAASMARLCERVRAGAGLLMLGGWESYHGLGGDYDATPLAELLPVVISSSDDRRNCSQLALVRKRMEHPILAALPFDMPPGIGGYNEFKARPSASVVLEGERYKITCSESGGPRKAEGSMESACTAGGGCATFSTCCTARASRTLIEGGCATSPGLVLEGRFPLLVVEQKERGARGAGRRACLATDVAPHWIGGFVDWGESRVTVRMGEDFIEVGAWYAAFFLNLLAWCLG